MKVTVVTLGLSALFLVAGCKGGGEMVKAQEDFANKACACKDMECIKKVQAEQQKWVTGHGQSAVGSEDDAKKIAAANKKLTDCVTKLAAGAAAKAAGGK